MADLLIALPSSASLHHLQETSDAMAPVRYDLAVASWRDSDIVSVVTATGNPIAYFPLDFILSGGDPQWTYVLVVIQQITDQSIGSQWSLEGPDSQPLDLKSIPRAGRYIYQSQG
jgi:hypothetical protein